MTSPTLPPSPTVKETKLIPLTKGKFAIVDAEDYDELSKFKWQAHKGDTTYYAYRFTPTGKRKCIIMHAQIAGTPKGMQTDHIDGNGLNNVRSNLRVVTNRQNAQNLHIKKSSKYPGICWKKGECRWCSQITLHRKRYHLGNFKDEFAAFQAYVVANVVIVGDAQ